MTTTPAMTPLARTCDEIRHLEDEIERSEPKLTRLRRLLPTVDGTVLPVPSALASDLRTFQAELQEVEGMLTELEAIPLPKLDHVLGDAVQGLKTLTEPIPDILTNIDTVASKLPAVAAQFATLVHPESGLEAGLASLTATLPTWSNSTPQAGTGAIGTGVLDAILSEMNRALADNQALEGKFETQVQSLVVKTNGLASRLSAPVESLSTIVDQLDPKLDAVIKFTGNYVSVLSQVSRLSSQVDQTAALLDTFKPKVDLVCGVMKPLGWFVNLIAQKACPDDQRTTGVTSFGAPEARAVYADPDRSANDKFAIFRDVVYAQLDASPIGRAIADAVEQMLPLTQLAKSLQTLVTDLETLSADQSIPDLLGLFAEATAARHAVTKELAALSTNAARATGTVAFTRTIPGHPLTLVKGTRVQVPGPVPAVFATTAPATFEASDLQSAPVSAVAQAVGTASNVVVGAITRFVSTPVRVTDADGHATWKPQPNPVNGDRISPTLSSAFTGGTDLSVGEIQHEAKALLDAMRPGLKTRMPRSNRG